MEKRISLRLSSAAPVTFSGLSPPRLTQSLMISSAWMGCSSSYFACSSSHQRPRRPIEQHLQPLGEVPDDRIERDQKVLDLPVDELILGRINDDGRVENGLPAGLERRIQLRHPLGVRGDLHCHGCSYHGRGWWHTRDIPVQRALNVRAAVELASLSRIVTWRTSRTGGLDKIYRVRILLRTM